MLTQLSGHGGPGQRQVSFSNGASAAGGGTNLKLHLAVTGVGWAFLPVAVLDGQERPSYNGLVAIDVRGLD